MPQIFGTWFWGFSPELHPFAGFTHLGSQRALIARAQPGDLIAIVGTNREPTADDDRRKLLGLIEFEPTAVASEDMFPPGIDQPSHLFEDGKFKWPYAVPAKAAWKFDPKKVVNDIIGRNLRQSARTGVDQLSPDEVAEVLKLPRTPAALPASIFAVRTARLGRIKPRLGSGSRGQPGPPPSEWSKLVSHEDGATATYLLRFGRTLSWKVGISKNPQERLASLNFSIPSEVLDGQKWELIFTEVWSSGRDAYAMEQSVLDSLRAYSQGSERVKALDTVVHRAWHGFLQGRSPNAPAPAPP